MGEATKRGLGKGLGAIIGAPSTEIDTEVGTETGTQTAVAHPDHPIRNTTPEPATAQSFQHDLVDSVLGAMVTAVPVDVALYVHRPRAGEPGAEPEPQERRVSVRFAADHDVGSDEHRLCYELFAGAEQAFGGPGIERFCAGDLSVLAVVTAGATSRGAWLLARREEALTIDEERLLSHFARTMGSVTHQLDSELQVGGAAAASSISLELGSDGARASVRVDLDGAGHTGSATDAHGPTAVANAVLDAIGSGHQLVDLREIELDTGRVVLVMIEEPDGDVGLGLSLCRDETLQAAATATYRAVQVQQPAGRLAPV